MAKDKKNEKDAKKAGAEEPKEGGKSKRKPLILGGGMLGLIAAAYIGAMVALPSDGTPPPFEGPFLADLSNGDIQVNLRGDARRFLVMTLRAEYEGYDQEYVAARTADPVYQAKLQDVLIGLARQKTREEMEDEIGLETFLVEVHEAVDPLIFPVHVGNSIAHTKAHEDSGLAPGESIEDSTMRGGFKAHVVHVDQLKGTLALDDGPSVSFDGSETDLELASAHGMTLYVDTTGVKEGYRGDVEVGTFGRVLSILKGRFLIQ